MSAGKPIIGITTYLVPAAWAAWNLEAVLVPASYVRAVEASGGVAFLVPPAAAADPAAVLSVVDGLVFSGGSDLDPELYDAELHPETAGIVRERDDAELVLMRAALDADLPLLAICRGSQVLNVVRGGDLVQHVPDEVGHSLHRETPGVFSVHEVSIDSSSRLGGILGDRHDVKSSHHQGFGRVGSGLVESAHAFDGSLEAVEDPSRRFALGVLWHPEEGEDLALFASLVAEAAELRAHRAAAA
jgi:gamma-glutamyl-gamma-aminobutyrate hydrolase PuuD